MSEPRTLMNAKEARAYLGLGRDVFRRWVKAGKIPVTVDPVTKSRWYAKPALDDAARRSFEAAS